ncbi:HNH endonuclease [Candidatus Parcubacteria bacterium]|nr:HNH endonuclease [Patescibacteria group bacterium]MBU4466473.1 HNH endonuclease [Patescibacteria group bacterium]MCG2688545.1 HNH endonuclease [Candidatus Parcubacteria bacterium]
MPNGKINKISIFYRLPFNNLISRLYLIDNLSTIEISEKIFKETKIFITPRAIQRRIKDLGLTRSLSDAFNIAIKKGRKSYAHLRKPVKSSKLRKGVNLRLRYEIFKRDNFRCVLCGNTPKESRLVIDHIIPVVDSGTNHPSNLRALCFECNEGKMISEERKR